MLYSDVANLCLKTAIGTALLRKHEYADMLNDIGRQSLENNVSIRASAEVDTPLELVIYVHFQC